MLMASACVERFEWSGREKSTLKVTSAGQEVGGRGGSATQGALFLTLWPASPHEAEMSSCSDLDLLRQSQAMRPLWWTWVTAGQKQNLKSSLKKNCLL